MTGILYGNTFATVPPLTCFVWVGSIENDARRQLGEGKFDGMSVIIKVNADQLTALQPVWNGQLPSGARPMLADAVSLRYWGVIPLEPFLSRDELATKLRACGFGDALERGLAELAALLST